MWTDGKVVRLTDAANLLFIALLNQADDSGRLKNDPKEIECKAPRFWERSKTLIDELAKVSLVVVYGKNAEFLQIKNFSKHQVIDRKRESEIPSPINRRSIADESTQGKEGIGKEGIGKDIPPTPLKGDMTLFDLWNSMASKSGGGYPLLVALSKVRIAKCRDRLKQIALPDWEKIFEKFLASKFLRGEVEVKDGKAWLATFDWLIKNDQNALKVLEGKYDNRDDGDGAAYVPGKYAGVKGGKMAEIFYQQTLEEEAKAKDRAKRGVTWLEEEQAKAKIEWDENHKGNGQ